MAGNTSEFGVRFGHAAAQGWSSWSVVRAGCIHSGEDVKIQTCALLKFLTILDRRLRITIMGMMVMMMAMMLVMPNDMTRKDI